MLSPGQIKLLRVAKAQLGLTDEDYRAELARHGGNPSAKALDNRGFDAVLDRFRQLGFETARRRAGYGDRIGMASNAQIELIRTLWAEVSGGLPEARLNLWLEHFGISALRFVTKAKAAKVLAALRAWKARKAVDA